jgi:ELWxxDGT repeat protein
MTIRRLLALVCWLPVACGPASGEGSWEGEEAPVSEALRPEAQGWQPCGTSASLVADIRPGPVGSRPRELVHFAGALFFTAEDGVRGRELWKSGGTEGAGASLVKDIRPGSLTSNPRRLTVAGDKLFFTAEDGVHGRELWVSDGTPAGTVMVKDIWPGAPGSAPDQLLAFEDVVYFAANDGRSGSELWVSDGTPGGTFLVEDLYPGEASPGLPGSSNPRRLTRVGDAFSFVATVGDTVQVCRGTGILGATCVFTGPEDNFLVSLTAVGPSLFFLVDNNEGEASLWRTRNGPAEYLRFFPGLYPHDLTPVGRRLFFSAGARGESLPGDPHGEELWVSDGTARGTELVKDLRPGTASSSPGSFAELDGWLYFAAEEDRHGRELWRSDGTSRGTTLLRDLVPGSAGASPQGLTALSGRLFFSADTLGHGREPWMSDGTADGTVPLREIAPGEAGSDPQAFTRSDSDVFFTATEAAHGEELWALPLRPKGRCRDRALASE